MYEALFERAKINIDALKVHLKSSQAMRIHLRRVIDSGGNIDGLDHDAFGSVDWKILDHCLVVTRLYAIYEHFCHYILSAHLGVIEKHCVYQQLSESLKTNHRTGVSRIIERIENPRYKDIDLPSFVEGYQQAISGKSYKLEPAAMLHHDQNLRLADLHGLMVRCGIEGLEGWLNQHPALDSFFKQTSGTATTVESKLTDMIKYRNEAAHFGLTIDEVLSETVLEEHCNFMIALLRALTDKVCDAGLDLLISTKNACVSGNVTEVFRKNKACVITATGKFALGEEVYIRGGTTCELAKILNIRMSDKDVPSVEVNNEEVGLLLSVVPSKFSEVITLTPSSDTILNKGEAAQVVKDGQEKSV